MCVTTVVLCSVIDDIRIIFSVINVNKDNYYLHENCHFYNAGLLPLFNRNFAPYYGVKFPFQYFQKLHYSYLQWY